VLVAADFLHGHVARHTRHGGRFVTVIIDLTPVRDSAGPARLLDMVSGRSKQVFTTWLNKRRCSYSRRL
jgi:transposase